MAWKRTLWGKTRLVVTQYDTSGITRMRSWEACALAGIKGGSVLVATNL